MSVDEGLKIFGTMKSMLNFRSVKYLCKEAVVLKSGSTNSERWRGNVGMRMDETHKLDVMEMKCLEYVKT